MKLTHSFPPMIALTVSVIAYACNYEDSAGNGGTGGSPSAGSTSLGGTPGSGGSVGSGGAKGGTVGSGGSVSSNGGTTTAKGGSVGSGGATTSGGTATTGGTTTAGGVTGNGGGPASGGSGGTPDGQGGAATTGGTVASGGSGGGAAPAAMGPCDVYKAGGTPCVAAYSTIRRINSEYTGPLYQVRTGSSAMNTGSGGETHDIGQTPDGFADAAAQDALCKGTFCTISLMYDQSGRENHLPVAKAGRSDGGATAAMDDFESKADAGPLKVAGRNVYSLYMAARQGYRMTRPGAGVPRGREPQGIYMLADGTHYGTACCWDFGNVTPDPKTYHEMNTLFFGVAFWGRGAGEDGPWFMADFEAGVWAGGSKLGDPGWGAIPSDPNQPPSPANTKNPALPVKYAIGFLKTDVNYALRMADLSTANSLVTAYDGPLPKPMDNQGAIVIGVGGDNSNNSWGTFYEGAVVAGYPTPATEDAVMLNVKAAGYGQ